MNTFRITSRILLSFAVISTVIFAVQGIDQAFASGYYRPSPPVYIPRPVPVPVPVPRPVPAPYPVYIPQPVPQPYPVYIPQPIIQPVYSTPIIQPIVQPIYQPVIQQVVPIVQPVIQPIIQQVIQQVVVSQPVYTQPTQYYSYNYQQPLNVVCKMQNTNAFVGTPSTWFANVSGGTGTYSFSWTGTDGIPNQNSQSLTVYYQTPGAKTTSVTVYSSDGQSLTSSCGTVYVY